MSDSLKDAETRLDVAECVLDECGTRTGEVAVYELYCQNPYNGIGEVHLAADELDVSVPKMVNPKRIGRGALPVYVGESQRIVERLYQHISGENAVAFTKLFPPKRIKAITWCADKDEARRVEYQTAREIRSQYNPRVVGGGK